MKPAQIESLKKKILVIYSAGCGNGKSEIAANLAFSIARKGIRTWVLDANTFTPAQDYIFGVNQFGPTFSHFLIDPSMHEMPVYPLNKIFSNPRPVPLFLTPAERDDQKTRFALQETFNSGTDIYSRIPEAVFKAMVHNKIDLLIIDTHPSFERINEVWMGMTECLLIISRINPVDVENLKSLLKDPSVGDINQKLVVFTNVHVDKALKASPDMDNTAMIEQLQELHRQFEHDNCVLDCTDAPTLPEGRTDIYEKAFLYSEKLALFQQAARRDGMFIEREPTDSFSVNIQQLGEMVVEMVGIKR
jgi:MinD-like ATPase involved in chromosome partitioning or flagellar assembly